MKATSPRSAHGRSAPPPGRRLEREHLVYRSKFLPARQRALVAAHIDCGVRPADLATLHNIPVPRMRRKLRTLCERLADPSFLLAARFCGNLPDDFRDIAHRYWVEGESIREIVMETRESMYAVRTHLRTARAMLVLHAREEAGCTATDAERLLLGILPRRKLA